MTTNILGYTCLIILYRYSCYGCAPFTPRSSRVVLVDRSALTLVVDTTALPRKKKGRQHVLHQQILGRKTRVVIDVLVLLSFGRLVVIPIVIVALRFPVHLVKFLYNAMSDKLVVIGNVLRGQLIFFVDFLVMTTVMVVKAMKALDEFVALE